MNRRSFRPVIATSLLLVCFSGVVAARELSFEDRVKAQQAIERVYWDHRIWPKENPGPKPPLSAVMPDSAIRTKVDDYLRMSALLDSYWHRPLRGEQLQAEIERMVRQTKAPGALRDLFGALGNDPFLIAECLARPTLAQRLVQSAFASDGLIHGAQREMLASKLSGVDSIAGLMRMDGDHAEITFVLDERSGAKSAPAGRMAFIATNPPARMAPCGRADTPVRTTMRSTCPAMSGTGRWPDSRAVSKSQGTATSG